MELKQYWEILRRRAWLIIGLTLLTLVVSTLATTSFAATYKATIGFAVKPQSDVRSMAFYSYDEYYAYIASEYLVDDVVELVETKAFRDDVVARLQGVVGGLPDKAIEAKKAHRVLIVDVTTGTRETSELVAQTIGTLLTEPGNRYFGNLSWQDPMVSIVDPPHVEQVGGSRKYIDIGLRTILGLLAAIGLAFLLDYLDNTISGAQQTEELIGLPVLGEIPRQKQALSRR